MLGEIVGLSKAEMEDSRSRVCNLRQMDDCGGGIGDGRGHRHSRPMKPSSLPVSPSDLAVHKAKVVIQDYGEHYQLYRGDELLGTTPFEFEANVGERIRVECRSNGIHVQTLTFDVGNNNVWSCRE